MARILITGGTGFLGSHLLKRLSRGRNEIFCLARRPAVLANRGRITWIIGDITDPSSYKRFLKKTDYIYHLAGIVNARRTDQYTQANVLGTKALLEACSQVAGTLKRFVYVSSIAAMGPISHKGLLDETLPCHPITEYGKSKLAAETAALEYSIEFPLVIIRPSFIYGRGDKRGLSILTSLLAHPAGAFRSSIKTISLCHVSDVIRCCLLAGLKKIRSGEVFIVSDGEVHTWENLRVIVHDICSRLGIIDVESPLTIRADFSTSDDDPRGRHYWGCDISKVKSTLGYEPTIRLKNGALDTIRWYLRNGHIEEHNSVLEGSELSNGDNYAAESYQTR
ncbi:MAG: hypothetical protein A2W25_07185 [candidate division Zixibacteria bacterium RBG_16_53_22]|nr:MAG: hypothetical protein A2W25_07185 [candidate division Zixibacteria bacterium RBG_16_53_22]